MPTDPHRSTSLGRLAAFAFRRRRLVVAGWLAALVAAIALGSVAGGAFSVDYGTPGSESQAAERLLEQRFDDRSEDTIDLVWTAPQGAGAPDVRRAVDGLLAEAAPLEGLQPATASGAEISPDGRVGVLRLAVDGRPDDVPEATALALKELGAQAPFELHVAGELEGLEEEEGVSAEVVGLAVALVVLLLTFGTVVAAGLPLATALFGLGISASLIGVLAAVSDVPDWAPQVGAMIGIGVGIDYALLVLTRHRAALAAGKGLEDAAVEALSTAGRSVVVAGGTVVISLAGLFLMGLPYLYGVALAAMLSVLVVVAAALTLLPALLGVMGRRIDALRVPGARRTVVEADVATSSAPAARWARAVQRRPVAATLVATTLLAALSLPATGLRLGFPDAGNDREGTGTREAYDLVTAGFGQGANGPLVVVAETPDATARAAVERLRDDVARQPGVAAVGEVAANGRGDAAVLAVTPRSAPQDQATVDLVHDLRDGPLARSGLQDVHLGGATASTVDQGEATADRLPLFIGGVVGLSFLLLLVAFRAPLVALKAAAMNLLSIGAAYGVVALVASGGWAGQLIGIDTDTPVPPFIPVMMFAILFGLSMDYEVFLLSRVRERLGLHGDPSRAVAEGLAGTARVITAAAAIMVAVFAAFALAPEVFLKLIGVGMATAILIDATIVRLVLVPATMQLLGARTWWVPRWLDRLLPDVELEPPRPPEAVPA